MAWGRGFFTAKIRYLEASSLLFDGTRSFLPIRADGSTVSLTDGWKNYLEKLEEYLFDIKDLFYRIDPRDDLRRSLLTVGSFVSFEILMCQVIGFHCFSDCFFDLR